MGVDSIQIDSRDYSPSLLYGAEEGGEEGPRTVGEDASTAATGVSWCTLVPW